MQSLFCAVFHLNIAISLNLNLYKLCAILIAHLFTRKTDMVIDSAFDSD